MPAKLGRPREKNVTQWAHWKRIQRSGVRGSHCQSCGKRLSGRGGIVDHVDGNQANASRKNLKTLCRSCHLRKSIKSGEV